MAYLNGKKILFSPNVIVDEEKNKNYELIKKVVIGYNALTEQPDDWGNPNSTFYENTGTDKSPVYTLLSEDSITFDFTMYYEISYTGLGEVVNYDRNGDGLGSPKVRFTLNNSQQVLEYWFNDSLWDSMQQELPIGSLAWINITPETSSEPEGNTVYKVPDFQPNKYFTYSDAGVLNYQMSLLVTKLKARIQLEESIPNLTITANAGKAGSYTGIAGFIYYNGPEKFYEFDCKIENGFADGGTLKKYTNSPQSGGSPIIAGTANYSMDCDSILTFGIDVSLPSGTVIEVYGIEV